MMLTVTNYKKTLLKVTLTVFTFVSRRFSWKPLTLRVWSIGIKMLSVKFYTRKLLCTFTLIVMNHAKILLEGSWALLRHSIFRSFTIFLKTVKPTSLMNRNQNIPLKIFHKKVPMHNDVNCDESWENSVRSHLIVFTTFVFCRFLEIR